MYSVQPPFMPRMDILSPPAGEYDDIEDHMVLFERLKKFSSRSAFRVETFASVFSLSFIEGVSTV